MAEEMKDNLEENKMANNKVTVSDAGPCLKKITIEIPEETIKASLEEQYAELKRDAAIPGFRKGRAPLRLLEKRFGEDVTKQVKLKLLAEASDKAIEDENINMLGDPEIDYENIELPESGAMEFSFEVEVRPEFELPELEGIEVEKPTIEITDEMIDEEVMQMRQRAGIWTPKEEGAKVEEGDQVIADTNLIIEGLDEHEKKDNVEIFAREKGFVGGVPVEGLDKLLKGAKAGDNKKTTVEVPETFFREEYRGKKIDVEIKIKDIKQLEPAELNEEFFKRIGVENEDELKEALRTQHSNQAEQEARSLMGEQIFDYLDEKIDIELPSSIVADQSRVILQRQYTNMLLRRTPKEQIDLQMEELRASSEEQATDQLKMFFIMSSVSDKLGIEVSEEEINGYIASVAAQRGKRPEKMREELAKDGSLAQFSLQIREQKCIEKILETAKISEAEATEVRKKVSKKKAATAQAKTGDEDKPKKTSAKSVKKESKDDSDKKTSSRAETAAKRTKKTVKKTDKKEK